MGLATLDRPHDVQYFETTNKQNTFVEKISEVYSKHCQTFKMEIFAKIVNGFQPLTFFAKSSIVEVWQGSEYASAFSL